MEKPEPEKDNPAPLRTPGEEKRVVTISRLREAFSLRHSAENKSRGPKATDPRRVSPRQKSSAQFPRALGPPCSRKRISEPGEEGRTSAQGPHDLMGRVETEEDSGHGSASAGSEEASSTPETSGHPSTDRVASSPEDRFSQENVESREKLPETDHHLSGSKCQVNQEESGSASGVLPQPAKLSSPNAKRFKNEGTPLNPDVLVCVRVCVCVRSVVSDPIDCSPPGSSVHGIIPARILDGLPFPSPEDLLHTVFICFSRG